MAAVTGHRELKRALEGLDKKMRTKMLNKAMSKAVRPVIQEARAKVRPISKTISKSLGIKRKRYQRGSVQVAVIGPRVKDNLISKKTVAHPLTGERVTRQHWPWNTTHLVELGTKAHVITLKKSGRKIQHPGTTAKPFLAPALEENQRKVVTIYGEVLGVEIEKYANSKS